MRPHDEVDEYGESGRLIAMRLNQRISKRECKPHEAYWTQEGYKIRFYPVQLEGSGMGLSWDDIARFESNQAKSISITPLNHGYEVKVGCQTLAIESPEKLCKHLLAYLKNPADVEKRFLAGKYKL